MTVRKKFKQLVRHRMQRTGESYTTARRQILAKRQPLVTTIPAPSHLAGSVPATTVLRVLLTHAGLRDSDGQPLSESMLFGLAGGIGLGVFQFYYEKEDIGTFFLAGRASWHDDLDYAQGLTTRLGLVTEVVETSGASKAKRQLRQALERGGPVMAWVDAEGLPHRATPDTMGGGSYHVVTIYSIDDDRGIAWIGDSADRPMAVSLAELARARARIGKQKHRLLWLPEQEGRNLEPAELVDLVRSGIRRCHELLDQPKMRHMAESFQLAALETWADRLSTTPRAKNRKTSWSRVFASDSNLWRGLTWIYDSIEHYGTGGGLCRPLMADFLSDAAGRLDQPTLRRLSERYRQLGQRWTELAHTALPDTVAGLKRARTLLGRKAELLHDGAPPAEIAAVWEELREHRDRQLRDFPLDQGAREELRLRLREHVLAIHRDEVEALAELRAFSEDH